MTYTMKIVGKSKAFQSVYDTAIFASQVDSRILLTGETGVGKDVFARLIHSKSKRKDNPFIAVNCATLTPELLQSELFGHVKGAFTGAIKDYKGKIRMADKGTLFLDEIGEIDIKLQSKLLKVLEDHIVHPVGSEKSYEVDLKIIAATNKDLKKSIEEKTFREDLYYRLDVFTIEIPPLRERMDDIPLLIDFFMKEASSKHGLRKKKFDRDVIEALKSYHWPGNIRELKNVVDKLLIANRASRITINNLPEYLQCNKTISKEELRNNILSLEISRQMGITIEDYKEFLILYELEKVDGNIRKASIKLEQFKITRQAIRTFLSKET